MVQFERWAYYYNMMISIILSIIILLGVYEEDIIWWENYYITYVGRKDLWYVCRTFISKLLGSWFPE